jgi:hypothetical protein
MTKVRRTYYFDKSMLQEIHEQAINKGVSDSDIVRMSIKEYVKKEKRKV